MRRTAWLIICLVGVVLAAGVTLAGQQLPRAAVAVPIRAAAPAVSAQELREIRNAVAQARAVNIWMVGLDFTGPVSDAGEYLRALTDEMEKQGLGTQVGAAKLDAYLVLHEDPDLKAESLRRESTPAPTAGGVPIQLTVALGVPRKLKVEAPLRMLRLQFSRAVAHVHTGPYEQLGHVYGAIRDAARARATETRQAGFPVALRLISDPLRTTQRNAIKTELLAPLKGEPRTPGRPTAVEGLVPAE